MAEKKTKAKAGRKQKTPAAKTDAAKKAAASAAAPTDETRPAPIDLEVPSGEVSKGELRDSITHFGVYYPAGTKASDVKPALSGDDRAKFERLGILA